MRLIPKGLVIHKSLRFGPLRVNLSGSGIGFSIKTLITTFGRRPNGTIYSHTNIPGVHGVSYRRNYFKKGKK